MLRQEISLYWLEIVAIVAELAMAQESANCIVPEADKQVRSKSVEK